MSSRELCTRARSHPNVGNSAIEWALWASNLYFIQISFSPSLPSLLPRLPGCRLFTHRLSVHCSFLKRWISLALAKRDVVPFRCSFHASGILVHKSLYHPRPFFVTVHICFHSLYVCFDGSIIILLYIIITSFYVQLKLEAGVGHLKSFEDFF